MNSAERVKYVPIGHLNDINVNATQECDSVNMKNFHKATFLVQYQTIAVQNHTVRLYSGAADAATTTAMTFRYAFGGAAQGAANCDKLAATLTSNGLVVANATYSDYLLVIEVDASEMTPGHSWLTLQTADDIVAGATGTYTALAVLEPRYTGNRSDSALA